MRATEELKQEMTRMSAELNSIRKSAPIADLLEGEKEKTERFFAEECDGDAEMLASVVKLMAEDHARKISNAYKRAK